MFDNVIVPLILAESLQEVNGKTRFQKLVFLIQRGAEERGIETIKLNFEIYLHGPFSQDLTLIIDNLVRDGYMDEYVEQTPPKYEMHVYRLTNKGREMLRTAKAKKLVSAQTTRIVQDIAERFGNLPLTQLVQEAYSRF